MLKTGILNPQINSLISRVRHTNTLVIADRGFPYWPEIETVDISLVDDIPKVLDVLQVLKKNFIIGHIWMAEEFKKENTDHIVEEFKHAIDTIPLTYEPHKEMKKRVPGAIGLIRTGETIQYANMILESA